MKKAVVLALFLALLGAASVRADDAVVVKDPPPTAEALAPATKSVRDSYKDAVAAAKTRQAKLDLVRKLILALPDEAANRATQCAMLELARQLTHESIDVQGAMVIAVATDHYFKVDLLKLQSDELLILGKAAKDWDDRKDLLRASDALIERAIKDNRYDVAKPTGDLFGSIARVLDSYSFSLEANERLAQLKECETAYAALQKSIATLNGTPTDADANSAVGRYTCMLKGDWEKGLPMLAAGSAEKMKTPAAKELSAKTDEEFAVAADGWFDVWGTQSGTAKELCRRHTLALYDKAVGGLTGPAKEKTLSRRRMLQREDPQTPEPPLEEQACNDFRKLAMTLPSMPSIPVEEQWDGRIRYHTGTAYDSGGVVVYGIDAAGESTEVAPTSHTYSSYFYDSHDHLRLIVVHALGKPPFLSDQIVYSADGPIVRITNGRTNYFVRYLYGKPFIRTEFVDGQLVPLKTKFFDEDEEIPNTGITAIAPIIKLDASGARIKPPRRAWTRVIDTAFSSAVSSPVSWPPRPVAPIVVVAEPPPVVARPVVIPAAAPKTVVIKPPPAAAPPAAAPVATTPPAPPSVEPPAAAAPHDPPKSTAAAAPPAPPPSIFVEPPPVATTAPAAPKPVAMAPPAPPPAPKPAPSPVIPPVPVAIAPPPKPLPPALPMSKALVEAQKLEDAGKFDQALTILRRSASITPLDQRPVDFDDTCRRLEGKASAAAVKPYMQAPEEMRE